MPTDHELRVLAAAGASPDGLSLTGPEQALPSVFDVTALATASIAAAHLAAAGLQAARSGAPAREVTVDRTQAAAAFLSERFFLPDGWERPPVWDPLAGDYPCADGWIRLHTNYSTHRRAALAALGVEDRADLDHAALAPVVAAHTGDELEAAVVAAGGCAAAMRTVDEWAVSPAGAAVAAAPLISWTVRAGSAASLPGGAVRPLDGVRVLDLTRVIAGPTCTRFLAAGGAAVLRIDPPGFAEVGALLPLTTAGKRCATLDLSTADGTTRFASLVADADVLVCGLRADALAGLGFDDDRLASLNPALVVARLDAYGWDGPWAGRRGFDSLVQMSSGIAAEGQRAAGTPTPKPLPCQALDHATGYLLAAAVCQALTARVQLGEASEARLALASTAHLLTSLPTPDGLGIEPPDLAAEATECVTTAWGPARAVPVPGRIDGVQRAPLRPAGPLGRNTPAFT
ncbi:MAG: CoA transferase [Ilumatobacteraceae bacterium]